MTHTELMAMLEETSLPIAYDHFAETSPLMARCT